MSSLPDSRFTESLVRENGLDRRGFHSWVFLPAMLFGAEEKWWGDRGKRTRPHEGLDVCLFSDSSGNLLRLEAGTRIPAMYDGTLVAIIDDFLGASIVIEHRLPQHHGPLLTIYGHMVATETLRVGNTVSQAEIIGVLAGTSRATVRIHPHLHISLAWPPGNASYDRLTWRDLSDPHLFTMTDPLSVIGGPYWVLEQIEGSPAEP